MIQAIILKPRRISSSGRKRHSVSGEKALRDPVRTQGSAVSAESLSRKGKLPDILAPGRPSEPVQSGCFEKGPSNLPPSEESYSAGEHGRGADKKPKPFKASIRDITSFDNVLTHSCSECESFAQLLRNQNISQARINAIIRHKSICEVSLTPPNIWEPWSQS